MKKTKALLITALAAALLMGGCGDKKDTTTATTTAAAVTTETVKDDTTEEKKTTEEKSESTTSTTTEATTAETTEMTTEESTEELPEDAPTVSEARELMNALNHVDYLGACAIESDYGTLYQDEKGYHYHPVTDPDFTSVEDIEDYINQYLTESFINERYRGITGTDTPLYIDVDGALYVLEAGKGAGFDFLEADPTIEKSSETGYTILANYDNFGALDTLAIMVENVDGEWKISGISYGM